MAYVQNLTKDELTQKYTAFDSFNEMLNAGGGYRPSIRTESTTGREQFDLWVLAQTYDLEQALRGDERRAFRS